MGVEKVRYDALTALYDGEAPPTSHFGPLPPDGSDNQKALGIACWYRHQPARAFGGTTVREWVIQFYTRQLTQGMWLHEPNSSQYHHLHSAPAWAIFDAALDHKDKEVAKVLYRWLRNDLAAAVLFATLQPDNAVRAAAPSARAGRIYSLSRDIALQQELGLPVERGEGHRWWDYRERRESLGPTIQKKVRPSLLGDEEKDAARAWVHNRKWSPALEPLVAPLRYRDTLRIVDTSEGWYAFFPELNDCWDNGQPAVAVRGRDVRHLRARNDATGADFWHTSPIHCEVVDGRLVARGQGHRGGPPTVDWQDEIAAPSGTGTRTIEIGPGGVRIDGRAVATPALVVPPHLGRDEETGGGGTTERPPAPAPMGPRTEELHRELGQQIAERRRLEQGGGLALHAQAIQASLTGQQLVLQALARELGL